jgi:predicted MPP superfamily phosphohydrolase
LCEILLSMILRFLLFFVFISLLELYAFQAIKTVVKGRFFLISYQTLSVLIVLYIIYSFTQYDRSVGQTPATMKITGLLLMVYIPKILVILILLAEDIYRIGFGAVNHFARFNDHDHFIDSRRKFVSQIALGIAAVPLLSLIYGVVAGKYNYKVIKQAIFFPDLPEAFDGFTITHISDIHSGSFDNSEKINYAIDLINEQNSDIILFTGDIVNTHATEMHPWIDTFKKIKEHKYGKYSILGNHDYGEYVTFSSQEAKEENFTAIKDLHRQIGFKLMLNENTFIEKGTDKIALIGVENWGTNFKKVGDISKASKNLSIEDFKILMSHDPSHWDAEVNKHPKHFHLTLSGHTHGMQFGIEIPGLFKWSPAQYIYKQWAGLYCSMGKYIYVNRGFGFHAYPGRVGIMPEITVIQLKKNKNVV